MDKIRLVIQVLDEIDVRGKTNMSKMLACIQALEEYIAMQEAKQATAPEVTADGSNGN